MFLKQRALREMRNFSAKLSPTLVNWSLNLVGTKSRNCCCLGYQLPAGPATCDRIFPLETLSWFFSLFLWLLFSSPLLITHSALELQLIYSLYFVSAESVSIDLTPHQCLSGSWDIISYLNCSQDVSTWLAFVLSKLVSKSRSSSSSKTSPPNSCISQHTQNRNHL